MFALNPVNHYLPFVCDTYANSDIVMFMFDAKIHMVNHIHAAWALLSMIKNVEEASPDMDMMANYESDDLKMIEAWGIANALHLVDETNTVSYSSLILNVKLKKSKVGMKEVQT